MVRKILRSGLLAALLLGCAGQRDNLESVPSKNKTSDEIPSYCESQFPSWWTPPRDVPIEYTDINGTIIQIYRGEIGFLQTFRRGNDSSPIHCISEWDFKYFASKCVSADYSDP